jgi:hypothetical protein
MKASPSPPLKTQWLHGRGWNMLTDKETPFAIGFETGRKAGQLS